MPFKDYLNWFKGTSINHDCKRRSHYKISNIGTNMANKKDIFLTFHLGEGINCEKEEFGIVCEQQGDRLYNYHKPETSGVKFVPSKFAMMLIYVNKEED